MSMAPMFLGSLTAELSPPDLRQVLMTETGSVFWLGTQREALVRQSSKYFLTSAFLQARVWLSSNFQAEALWTTGASFTRQNKLSGNKFLDITGLRPFKTLFHRKDTYSQVKYNKPEPTESLTLTRFLIRPRLLHLYIWQYLYFVGK